MNKYFNVFNIAAAVIAGSTVAISVGALRTYRKIMKGVDQIAN